MIYSPPFSVASNPSANSPRPRWRYIRCHHRPPLPEKEGNPNSSSATGSRAHHTTAGQKKKKTGRIYELDSQKGTGSKGWGVHDRFRRRRRRLGILCHIFFLLFFQLLRFHESRTKKSYQGNIIEKNRKKGSGKGGPRVRKRCYIRHFVSGPNGPDEAKYTTSMAAKSNVTARKFTNTRHAAPWAPASV